MHTHLPILETSYANGIRYHDSGTVSGILPTVLLLHGLGNSLDFWTAIVPRLQPLTRTIAIDIPGFGQSAPPPAGLSLESASAAITELLRVLGATPAAIVAHSMGAYVAIEIARRFPESATQLILVDGTLYRVHRMIHAPSRLLIEPALAAVTAAQFLGGLIPLSTRRAHFLTSSALMRQIVFWPYLARPGHVTPLLLDAALANNAGSSILRSLLIARRTSLEILTHGVTQQVDVVFGEQDRLVAEGDLTAFRSLLNIRSVTALPDCGHWPMVEAPEHLSEVILRYIAPASRPRT